MKINLAVKIVLIVLALIVGGFLTQIGIYIYKIKTGRINPAYHFSSAKKISGETTMNSADILNSKAPFYGSTDPELTIVEFGNFACPYSKEESLIAREMMIKHKAQVKFIYRDYPMDDVYPDSSALSLAGKCVAEQNNILFWAMHDKLYGAEKPDANETASQIGVDKNKFSDCMNKQKYLTDLQKDMLDGYKNGVAGTPTFFFIKKGYETRPLRVEGAIPKGIFQQIIDNLLKS